ncbi:MAG: hypothetical protein M9904_02325 [Chitinophagaceae bacterium]|nr:hypothetical protein [Chitinophagaceae bacterium]
MEETKKVYPTAPDADGWFYENEDEETAGVQTRTYENMSRAKRVFISGNREVMVRELKGRDFSIIQDITKDGKIGFEAATMSLCVKINDQGYPAEYYMDDLRLGDFSKILIPVGRINFS